jgi:hypothetical protein
VSNKVEVLQRVGSKLDGMVAFVRDRLAVEDSKKRNGEEQRCLLPE